MLIAALSAIASFCGPCEHAGPNTTAEQPEWLADLVADREATLKKLKWAGGVFENPALRWTQTSYIQPQMHPYDRYFYDPQLGYTPEKFLADLNARYGGVDSILMWPTYTNIGTDDRSQFDLFEAMPGGIAGVRRAVDELHAAGVKVLIPYNPCAIPRSRSAGCSGSGSGSSRCCCCGQGTRGRSAAVRAWRRAAATPTSPLRPPRTLATAPVNRSERSRSG